MEHNDEEMRDILEAMVPDESGALAGADRESGAYGADTDAEESRAAADADDPDGWVTHDEVGGITFRRLGKAAKRAMIVALPGKALDHTKISEMTAIAAIPSGYQIIEAELPLEKEAVSETSDAAAESAAPVYSEASIEASERYLDALFDKISREGFSNVYLLAYDTAVPVSIKALRHKEIKRAYFVSPDFKLNGTAVSGPWKIETEILRGSRDADVPEKEVRHFMKNSRSHMSRIDMGHRMTEDEQFAAFGRWLTGARSNRYTDNGFVMMMALGLLVGYLAGWFLFSNSVVGLILGAACGIIFYLVYKKI